MESVVGKLDHIRAVRAEAEEQLLVGAYPHALRASSGTQAFGYENIVGVGIGERRVAGHPVSEDSIVVYVINKARPDEVEPSALVPPAYDGIPTDVVESGEFVAATGRGRHRPALSGVSLAHFEGTTGTFGFPARRGGAIGLVSNNHVLAREDRAARGDAILQPGPSDGGTAADELAQLTEWVSLDFVGGQNLVDAAFAEAPAGVVTSGVLGMGPITTTPAEPRRDLLVRKRGRTSGFTRGLVSDIDATIRLRYESGSALLREQIVIRGVDSAFSEPGDSGALVFDETTRGPVGLLCGGSARFALANQISHVLDGLGLSFIS